jgi:predicted ATP-dependent endonuclease of OLD family
MRLISFRVQNYRSINDSGDIAVSKLTSLVGRNESGKTNLLLALQTLNPAGGIKDLLPIKDFPRQRRLGECTNGTPVVSTTWELNDSEQGDLATKFPRATGVTLVKITRSYKADRETEFVDLKPIAFSADEVAARLRKIRPVAEVEIDKLEEVQQHSAKEALETFATALAVTSAPPDWATCVAPVLASFRKALAAASITLPDREDGLLSELEDLAAQISKDGPAFQAARHWAVTLLPTFVYVDDYPELTGHQNIAEYLARKRASPSQLNDSDRNFEKMCKVADLDPEQFNQLRSQNDHETRNQLANRAGAIVTTELRRLWKDRQLKVRFSPDADHLDTFVSDPNSVYDVEVNLDERSRGLKWFFSFYITFSADTKGGTAQNAILLLDEPGLYLHALSQGDLLNHFAADFDNQIIYTTHSPFMVPTEKLDAIRTVSIGQETGTIVSNDPAGDSRTLFPIQAALGYSLSQSLFVGPNNLVVEGVTDYWMLSSASSYLESLGKTGLPEGMTLTPAGGAQKIPYMVSLLTSERLQVLVLFDEEKQSRATRDELVKAKLIRDDNIVFVTDGFETSAKPAEADIEDLFEPTVYGILVSESYSKELTGKKLKLNAQIPRIVKRYEQAFQDIGIEFHKTRPSRLLLNKMATDAAKIIPQSTVERFERLFGRISKLYATNIKRNGEPFS